jgi:hypothetical protein
MFHERGNKFLRINLGRPGWIHIRDHRFGTQSSGKETEKRKPG